MSCRENRYICLTPLARMEKGRGGREGGDREGEREKEASREVGARAKPGNQLVVCVLWLIINCSMSIITMPA